VDGVIITSQADIANTFALYFASLCISDRYDSAFRWIKQNVEILSVARSHITFAAFTVTEFIIS